MCVKSNVALLGVKVLPCKELQIGFLVYDAILSYVRLKKVRVALLCARKSLGRKGSQRVPFRYAAIRAD